MVAETDSGRYGFVVDQVLGDHQTVIKNLGRFYRNVQIVSGATVLGNGSVALILDPHRLVQKRLRRASWASTAAPAVATRVRMDEVSSSEMTILDVLTQDRPGLLHTIADALHRTGVSIVVARIATEGNRATDAFYLRGKITDRARLGEIPGWDVGEKSLVRKLALPSFPEAIAFTVKVAFVAEAADHHPDIAINYRRVTLSWSTHDEGGLTLKDIDGAKMAELHAREQA